MVVRRVLNAVGIAVAWLAVAVSVLITVFAIVSARVVDRRDRGLFGYRFFIVQSDSMAATDFAEGDIVITEEVNPATLQEGDIITFVSQDWASFGETVTHKIRRRTEDSYGNPGFITYGTTTDSDDATVVTYEYVVGQYRGRIPGAGALFEYVRTVPGLIICLVIPFLLVLVLHGWNLVRLFLAWRRDQLLAIEQKEKDIRAMLEALEALETRYGGTAQQEFLAEAREIVNETRNKLAPAKEDPEA